MKQRGWKINTESDTRSGCLGWVAIVALFIVVKILFV